MKVIAAAVVATLTILFALTSQSLADDKPYLGSEQEVPTVQDVNCGRMAGFVRGSGLSQIAVTSVNKITCSTGKKVIRQCLSKKKLSGWKRSGDGLITSLNHKGGKRVSFAIDSGPMPRCVGRQGMGVNNIDINHYGPYQQPLAYPSNWPAPYKTIEDWGANPVRSQTVTFNTQNIVTANMQGRVFNPKGNVRAVWFEYGKTRDLGTASDKVEPKQAEYSVPFYLNLTHLKAKQRYYWQTKAKVDNSDGTTSEYSGAVGSFVTKPYPKLDSDRPCKDISSPNSRIEVTESLALFCNVNLHFHADSCYITPCSFGYSGRIECDKDYPRNLNSGGFKINVRLPYAGVIVPVGSFDRIVSYWRSNDSNRFTTFPGYQKNDSGGEVGPIPGWHNWNVDQWSYPFKSTNTDAEFYISCTQQWGDVQSTDALIAGQGDDSSDNLIPAAAQDIKVSQNSDGSISGSWGAPDPDKTQPFKISGYFFTPFAFPKGEKPKLNPEAMTPVTTTSTSGTVPKAALDIWRKAFDSSKYELVMMVVPVSTEGRSGTIATAPLPSQTKKKK